MNTAHAPSDLRTLAMLPLGSERRIARRASKILARWDRHDENSATYAARTVTPNIDPIRIPLRVLLIKALDALAAAGNHSTPIDYLCAALESGKNSYGIADDLRDWIKANAPQHKRPDFPRRFFVERFVLRAFPARQGSEAVCRVTAARAVCREVVAARVRARNDAQRRTVKHLLASPDVFAALASSVFIPAPLYPRVSVDTLASLTAANCAAGATL